MTILKSSGCIKCNFFTSLHSLCHFKWLKSVVLKRYLYQFVNSYYLVRIQVGQGNQGALGVYKGIIRDQGYRGLFRGVLPPIYSMAIVNAFLFGVEGVASRSFGSYSNSKNILCGSCLLFNSCSQQF